MVPMNVIGYSSVKNSQERDTVMFISFFTTKVLTIRRTDNQTMINTTE